MSIPQKGIGFDHLGARDEYFFWCIDAVEVIEATEVVEAVEVIEAAKVLRPGISLIITAESSRFLNSALCWCFENKY
jgi:hypothetical protein